MVDTESNHYYNITFHKVGEYIKFIIGYSNKCLFGLYMYDTKHICHHIILDLLDSPIFTESSTPDSIYINSNKIKHFDILLPDIDSDEIILNLLNSTYLIELFNKYKNEQINYNKFNTKLIINGKVKYIKYKIPQLLQLVINSKKIEQRELLYLSDFYSGLDEFI